MSAEISEFVTQLLSHEPGAPNSVQLVVDTDGDLQALFEVLLMTMTEMMKKWYTPPIKISRVSPRDLDRMQQYFGSFGYLIQLEVTAVPPVLHVNNREYLQKSRLEEMRFRMTDEGRLYTVHFSKLARI